MSSFCRALLVWFVMLHGSLICLRAASPSRPFLSPVFGDHMVLQRDKPNRLWGWATPGSKVSLVLEGASVGAVVAPDGRWELDFMPPKAGGPYELRLQGDCERVLKDVLVGDVWLCGGQSNMAMGLGSVADGPAELLAADHPGIRLYQAPREVSYDDEVSEASAWHVCTPATAGEGGWGGFSAVAYYFGRRLHRELGVPIGLIQDAVGGTPVECWMDPATLRRLPDFAAALAEVDRCRAAGLPEYGNFISHWYDEHDLGQRGSGWQDPALDDASWTPVTLPGGFRELGLPESPAVAWFRRDFELPPVLPPGEVRLELGVVEKMDSAYVNGRWVGASSWVENPRSYPVARELLKPGLNRIALRVFKLSADGGFRSPPEGLRLRLGDGTLVPLAGAWKGRVSVDVRPPVSLPLGYENYPTMPSVLFQGMIRPLAPLALRGFVWYQGEANTSRAWQYRTLLPAMISDWRRLFGQGDLPFLIAGLPAFMERAAQPGDDDWAELRDAQAWVASSVPAVHLSVNIDTGEAADIHPKDKRPVGERLAACALARVHGVAVADAGPRFFFLEPLAGALRVRFSTTNGGLVVRGPALDGFAVAGEDRVWHWASAVLDEGGVRVSSPAVPQPVAVRYAWQANPPATLFDAAGLPAAPFRTDTWPLHTQPAP